MQVVTSSTAAHHPAARTCQPACRTAGPTRPGSHTRASRHQYLSTNKQNRQSKTYVYMPNHARSGAYLQKANG